MRAYGQMANTCTETAMAVLYAVFKEKLSCNDIGRGYNYTFEQVAVTGFCFLSVAPEDHGHRYYGAVTRGATNANTAMKYWW